MTGARLDRLKRLVRPLVPAGLRRAVRIALTPAHERYAQADLERVKAVTAAVWRGAAHRSAKYVPGYWDEVDRVERRTRASRRSEWLAALPPFAAAESALEIGCASGRNLYVLQERYPRMRLGGIDISPEAVAHAQSRVRGEFLVGDLYESAAMLAGRTVDIIFTMGVLIHLHPGALPGLLAEMRRHARRHLVLCEQLSGMNEVVKGPAWWRPSRKVTGDYIQWSPDLPAMLRRLGLPCEVSDVPGVLQSNGARHLVVVPLR